MIQESYLSKLSLLFNMGGCAFSAHFPSVELTVQSVGIACNIHCMRCQLPKEQFETHGLHLHETRVCTPALQKSNY